MIREYSIKLGDRLTPLGSSKRRPCHRGSVGPFVGMEDLWDPIRSRVLRESL